MARGRRASLAELALLRELRQFSGLQNVADPVAPRRHLSRQMFAADYPPRAAIAARTAASSTLETLMPERPASRLTHSSTSGASRTLVNRRRTCGGKGLRPSGLLLTPLRGIVSLIM